MLYLLLYVLFSFPVLTYVLPPFVSSQTLGVLALWCQSLLDLCRVSVEAVLFECWCEPEWTGRGNSMLLILHAGLCWCLFGFPWRAPGCVCNSVLTCVLPSPECDIRREESVLPGSGFGSGSILLLSTHPEEHHQADLLLQPSRQSLGTQLPEMSVLWFRLVTRNSTASWLRKGKHAKQLLSPAKQSHVKHLPPFLNFYSHKFSDLAWEVLENFDTHSPQRMNPTNCWLFPELQFALLKTWFLKVSSGSSSSGL